MSRDKQLDQYTIITIQALAKKYPLAEVSKMTGIHIAQIRKALGIIKRPTNEDD